MTAVLAAGTVLVVAAVTVAGDLLRRIVCAS